MNGDPVRVCIIGAGLSGLVCGMRLSKKGAKVTIVEELTYPGGLLASTRTGRENLELIPHHLRKTDRTLLSLIKEVGLDDKVEWFDSLWYGRASHKKVGYFGDGFSVLINRLIQDITDNGGNIHYSTTVCEISAGEKTYTTSCVLTDSGKLDIESDYVIFTGSCRSFVSISHGLPIPLNIKDQLMNITYKASVSLMMVMKTKSTDVYLRQVKGPSSIKRIVNHTNCFGTRGYGGNVVYLVGEVNISDPLWIASDEEIMAAYFAAFRKTYPSVRKSDIRSWRITKVRYATSERYPDQDLTNPLEGLYVCSESLSKFGVSDVPENRMDPVVSLANGICRKIAEKEAQAT